MKQPFRVIEVTTNQNGEKIFDNTYLNKNSTELGHGTYGTVLKAENISVPNKYYALKRLASKVEDKESFIQSRKAREASILLQSKSLSTRIIRYEDCFFDVSGYFYLALEYCDGGDLKNQIMLKKENPNQYDFETVTVWAEEIIDGLFFLSSFQIIHRDIKPSNILLNNGKIKIGDFGEAKNLNNTSPKTSTVGTLFYNSPEILSYKEIACITDIWSTGVVLYELVNLKRPFELDTDINDEFAEIRDILNYDKQVCFDNFTANTPEFLIELMKRMLQKNTEERNDAEALVKFIKSKNVILNSNIQETEGISENQAELSKDFCSISDRPSWARCAVIRRKKMKKENSPDWISDSVRSIFNDNPSISYKDLRQALLEKKDCQIDYNRIVCLLQNYDRNRDGKIYYDEFYQLFDDLNKKYKEFLEINQNSSEIMISGKMSKLFSINGFEFSTNFYSNIFEEMSKRDLLPQNKINFDTYVMIMARFADLINNFKKMPQRLDRPIDKNDLEQFIQEHYFDRTNLE